MLMCSYLNPNRAIYLVKRKDALERLTDMICGPDYTARAQNQNTAITSTALLLNCQRTYLRHE
jgi:hypothetical protein